MVTLANRFVEFIALSLVFTFWVSAQSPTISSFTPESGPVGTEVTISGTNFSTNPSHNIVYFDATRASVSSASNSSLTVTVPIGATFAPISVTAESLTTYSDRNFLVTFISRNQINDTSFASKVDIGTMDPYNLALGDIDGDGKTDIVVSNQFNATLSVYRNISTTGTLSSSSFASLLTFTVGDRPVGIAFGDLDGDGKPDLAVSNYNSSSVSVLHNTSTSGSISFDTHVQFATDPGSAPFNVIIIDVNADGKPDLAAANDVGGTISVFENTSIVGSITSSSFATKVDFATDADPYVAVGDIDGDGKPDLVAANWGSNSVSVLRNTSTGGSITTSSFAAKVDFGTDVNPFSVSIGDIDGDGKLDLVAPNESESSASASILRNTSTSGSVSFASKVDFATGLGSRFSVITDLDGDGKPDVAVCNRLDNEIAVLKNTSTSGSLSFNTKVLFATGVRPRHILAGDLDGDKKPDIVVADEGSTPGANFFSLFRNTVVVPPIASVSPTSILFGNQRINTTSSIHISNLQNIGGEPLHVDSITISGDFSQTNSLPVSPATLAPESTGTFNVTFTPTATGLRNGTITIYDNAVSSPQTISLSGTGTTPIATLSTSSIAFGNQRVGTTSTIHSIVVKNTGTASLTISSDSVGAEFSLSGPSLPVVINPGDSVAFSARYAPTIVSPASGTIKFVDNASGSPHTVSVSGNGVQSAVHLSTTTLSFGNQRVGTTSAAQMVTLTNNGNDALTITSISASTEFGRTHTLPISPLTLAPESSGTISVTFSPTSAGAKNGSITIVDDAPGNPHTISLSGTGTISIFAPNPSSVSFFDVFIDVVKLDSITVTNNGTASLNISSATSTNGQFIVSPSSATIAPSANTKFYVSFHPTTLGLKTGRLIFTHDGSTSPDSIPFTGTGVVTVNILKFKDTDGNILTSGDRSPKNWMLALYKDSVSVGSLVSSAVTNNLQTDISQAGTYIACESDSGAAWYRLNGNHTRYDTLQILSSAVSDTFVNFKGNSITVQKYRDTDGQFVTAGDRSLIGWHLEIRKDSLAGQLVASGNGPTLSATNLGDGTYYAVEADSAGWTHFGYVVNGTPTATTATFTSVTVSDGQLATVDFVNFHSNSLTVRKFKDDDGKFSTSGDRSAKSWHLEIRSGAINGPAVASTNGGTSVTANDLADGLFYAVESDSTGWVHLGYVINGIATVSGDNNAQFNLVNGQHGTLDFINAPPIYSQRFRTFKPDSIALSKDSKGKIGKLVKPAPDKIMFSVGVKNDSSNITDLHVEFGAAINTNFPLTTVPPSTQSTSDPRLKVWNFIFTTPLSANDSVYIYGYANTTKPLKVTKYYWTRNNSPLGGNKKNASIVSILRYPMPNRINVLSEAFSHGEFASTSGLLVGKVRSIGTDSSKFYGWLLAPKYTDVLKTLSDKSGLDTGPAFGFGTYTSSGRPIMRQQKTLPPTKENNQLIADMVALKLNIAASALGTTPNGLGELIYDDSVANQWNGKMIKEIASFGDSVMMGYYSNGLHKFADSLLFRQLDSVVHKINGAFEGPMDTASFASQLIVKGTRRLDSVSIFRANPSVIPATITPTDINGSVVPVAYTLYQNYPNPFNPTTTIQFDLVNPSVVTLKIYNLLGQEVAALADRQPMEDGQQEFEFNANLLASGVYFYRIVAEEIANEEDGISGKQFVSVKKMLLLK